jgi:hypothetical protein
MDGLEHGVAVVDSADDIDARIRLEEQLEPSTDEGVVVDEKDPDTHLTS